LRSQSEPQRVSESSENSTVATKMKRPTSLSDEWKELQKIKMNQNPSSETLTPERTIMALVKIQTYMMRVLM
jgi:hypothetical protein